MKSDKFNALTGLIQFYKAFESSRLFLSQYKGLNNKTTYTDVYRHVPAYILKGNLSDPFLLLSELKKKN